MRQWMLGARSVAGGGRIGLGQASLRHRAGFLNPASFMNPSQGRARLHEWVVVGVFCAFFFFYGLAAFGLVGADEPRYAQIAREMLARHDWVSPTLYGRVWLDKPVLYYCSAMLSYRAFGGSDCAARIPSSLLAS